MFEKIGLANIHPCYLVYTFLVRHGQKDVRLSLPGVGSEDGRPV